MGWVDLRITELFTRMKTQTPFVVCTVEKQSTKVIVENFWQLFSFSLSDCHWGYHYFRFATINDYKYVQIIMKMSTDFLLTLEDIWVLFVILVNIVQILLLFFCGLINYSVRKYIKNVLKSDNFHYLVLLWMVTRVLHTKLFASINWTKVF